MIPTDSLLDDLQRVATDLGHSPTAQEYREYGNHGLTTIENRFESWNKAKEKAGLEIGQQSEIPVDDLLADLQRVATDLGHSPSRSEYGEHGNHSSTTIENRFESWNKAKEKVGLRIVQQKTEVSVDDLLNDLRRVADKLDKSPNVSEYNTHGKWSMNPIYTQIGSLNVALDAAGLPVVDSFSLSTEDYLNHLRSWWEDSQVTGQHDFLSDWTAFSRRSCRSRFGKPWRALVRAGINPPVAPLCATDYNQYIQTAINAEDPQISIIGLLKAFTGVPTSAFQQFDLSWVSRIDDEYQPPLLTVPSEYIVADEDWVMILPTNYTIAGETRPTHLVEWLDWMKDYMEILSPEVRYINEIIDRSGVDAGLESLRASVAAHLVRRGVSKGEIEMQVGTQKTDWWLSVEDFYLYVYQFEGYCHPDYEPSGVYLDPDSGDAERIGSESN